MKGERYIVFLIAAVLLAGCQREPEVQLNVRECAPLPAGGRASASVCVLNGKAYVFAGRDKNGKYLNDLWQYDPKTDTWTDLGTTPMKPRVNATMAAYDGKIYAGLGYAGYGVYRDSSYLQDWWEYTPASAEWRLLTNYPNTNTIACVAFAMKDVIYVLYGFGHKQTSQVCIYSPAQDAWQVLPDNINRPRVRFGERAALHNGLLYFGTGYTTDGSMRDWYAADIVKDSWSSRESIPGKGREFTSCASTKNFIYLFGGRHFAGEMTGGEVFDSYMRYSPEKDQWKWCGTMPCGRAENMVAFSIDGKVYFGLGENENGKALNTLYCIEE